jgi:CRISPR-associated exonuclease Cas4
VEPARLSSVTASPLQNGARTGAFDTDPVGNGKRPQRVCILPAGALVSRASSTRGSYASRDPFRGTRDPVSRARDRSRGPSARSTRLVSGRDRGGRPVCGRRDRLALVPISAEDLALALIGLGAVGLVLGPWSLIRWIRDQRYGELRSVDLGGGDTAPLQSLRYRLSGRPDEVRELPDGRCIPIEIKSRATPRSGPPWSHRIQVAGYCLLLEETTGRAPPFGVVRYGDGSEFRLPWDAASRAELLDLLAEMRRPYDGRGTPSPGKCRGCSWRNGCDLRAA